MADTQPFRNTSVTGADGGSIRGCLALSGESEWVLSIEAHFETGGFWALRVNRRIIVATPRPS